MKRKQYKEFEERDSLDICMEANEAWKQEERDLYRTLKQFWGEA